MRENFEFCGLGAPPGPGMRWCSCDLGTVNGSGTGQGREMGLRGGQADSKLSPEEGVSVWGTCTCEHGRQEGGGRGLGDPPGSTWAQGSGGQRLRTEACGPLQGCRGL